MKQQKYLPICECGSSEDHLIGISCDEYREIRAKHPRNVFVRSATCTQPIGHNRQILEQTDKYIVIGWKEQ